VSRLDNHSVPVAALVSLRAITTMPIRAIHRVRWLLASGRILAVVVLFGVGELCWADPATKFLDALCLRGFQTTTMPKSEAERFCTCMRADIAPRLTHEQRGALVGAQVDVDGGRSPSAQRLASTGVRDLVVAAQARCEASFYPPSEPINISAGALQLTLRCEQETRAPEAFVYVKGGALLSKAEMLAADQRMMKGDVDPQYAQVLQKLDGTQSKAERWEIDLTGEIVSPPSAAELIARLRVASSYEVIIQRGQKRFAASIPVSGRIPPRWAPCGGVGR
jgi:hypothetical protein